MCIRSRHVTWMNKLVRAPPPYLDADPKPIFLFFFFFSPRKLNSPGDEENRLDDPDIRVNGVELYYPGRSRRLMLCGASKNW
jgi:hypothetical protein